MLERTNIDGPNSVSVYDDCASCVGESCPMRTVVITAILVIGAAQIMWRVVRLRPSPLVIELMDGE
jgi:hypothetical protein